MLGLFAFRLVSTSVSRGARSVVGGGKLILNTAFPRLLLPLDCARRSCAFCRRSPSTRSCTLLGLPIRPRSSGRPDHRAHHGLRRRRGDVHRDVAGLLPRPDELSPVLHADLALHLADPLLRRGRPQKLRPILYCNPMYPMLGSLNDAVIEGRMPPAGLLAASLVWAVATVMAGTPSSSPGSVSLRSASENPAVTPEPTPGATPWAVKVENLSVTYRTTVEKKPTLRRRSSASAGGSGSSARSRRCATSPSRSRTAPRSAAVGVNGAGKSTLLRTMAGILPPSRAAWGSSVG